MAGMDRVPSACRHVRRHRNGVGKNPFSGKSTAAGEMISSRLPDGDR